MQEEHLRVSLENQLQLFSQVINDQKQQMQKVVDSLRILHIGNATWKFSGQKKY